jgi:hypothetical protein
MDPTAIRRVFRGKPPATKRNEFDMPCIVVTPTDLDKNWNFSDTPANSEAEYLDMLHPSDARTAAQRLASSACSVDSTSDSQEIGIQCFEDNRWPERTDLRCWWCLHQFDTRPFPCPVFKSRSGLLRIRGVFCGPSCAKAWALVDRRFHNACYVESLINELAHKRGFLTPDRRHFYIPPAPPRESLDIFCGSEGLSIGQFRGLCAAGFDVGILRPPIITEKQIIIAECERMQRISKMPAHRTMHVDEIDGLIIPAAVYAKRRREGFEIFAGVGAKRLTDFIGTATQKPVGKPRPPPPDNNKTAPAPPTKSGKIKKPLPIIKPQALPVRKKRAIGSVEKMA